MLQIREFVNSPLLWSIIQDFVPINRNVHTRNVDTSNAAYTSQKGELSGRVLDLRLKGRGFEPHRHHCVVSLSKNINPSLVLVQPRETRPFITERLLMGRKESNKNASKGTFLPLVTFLSI